MVRDRFIDTMTVLRSNHAGEFQARVVNVTASTVTVRMQGEETVFSRSTGKVLKGNRDLSMHPIELCWYAPQNKQPLGRGASHLS